jgi:hypothetical protein
MVIVDDKDDDADDDNDAEAVTGGDGGLKRMACASRSIRNAAAADAAVATAVRFSLTLSWPPPPPLLPPLPRRKRDFAVAGAAADDCTRRSVV